MTGGPPVGEGTSTQVAVVTGGGTGIGRAITEAFTRLGVDCVICGRRNEPLVKTQEALLSAPGSVLPIVTDVTQEDGRSRLVEQTLERFGRVDILVNNAGITATAPILDYQVEDWRAVLATHVEAAFFLSQAVAEPMRDSGGGRIVNIGSVYGSLGLQNDYYGSRLPWATPGDRGPVREVAYSAAKGALIQLTRELATALGRWKITVNTVTPGMVPVDAIPMAPDVRERLSAMTPLGRLGLPSEIAAAVVFMASEQASFITGAELKVDGGWSIW